MVSSFPLHAQRAVRPPSAAPVNAPRAVSPTRPGPLVTWQTTSVHERVECVTVRSGTAIFRMPCVHFGVFRYKTARFHHER